MRFISFFVLGLLFASPSSWAQSELDLAALQQFFATGERLEQTSSKYPELEEDDQEFLLDGDNQVLIDRLKKAGAFDEFSAIVKKSGYDSMNEYINITKRIMAAFFAVQLQQSPYSSEKEMHALVDSQKKALADNGIEPAVIEQMMVSVNAQLEQVKQLYAFSKGAQPADIEVVNKHLEYVSQELGN